MVVVVVVGQPSLKRGRRLACPRPSRMSRTAKPPLIPPLIPARNTRLERVVGGRGSGRRVFGKRPVD